MNYFEDIALYQSGITGVGMEYLNENNLAWVLYRWDIDIKKYPRYGDRVKVRTVPNSFYKFCAYRKFEMENAGGDIIARGVSEWLLLKADSKKPVRIPESIYRAYNIDMDCSDKIEMENLKSPDKIDFEKLFDVRYSDIDTNMHVNNVKYIDWCMETMPVDIVRECMLKKLLVTYKKETKYGEIIKAQTEVMKDEGTITCRHRIVDMEGRELCLLKTIWAYE